MITPYKHQIEIADKAYKILKHNMIVYLAMEERTGKTLTSLLVVEKCENVNNVLVITKKKALDGWIDTISKYPLSKNITLINYHSVNKIKCKPDLVIIDEAHAYLSAYPKAGTIWLDVAKYTKEVPIIYLSATPSSQSFSMLYHQFKLSSWSPFLQWNTFYKWFKEFGIEKKKYVGSGRQVNDYTETIDDKVREYCKHLFISYSRQELDFTYEPEDVLHYIDLDAKTKEIYKHLEKDKYLILKDEEIIADTPMSLLLKLHQIEGGTLKIDDKNYLLLDNTEKIQFIKQNFGDTKDIVIFYHYQAELVKLQKHFKNALLLQATSFAEGVDLSMYETLIVYSMNFSTAQYTQRRARQANIKRDTPIKVHFLLCKDLISDMVYKSVAINKKNFVDSYYQKNKKD